MLTAEQLELRKNHIGASDMSAILGVSPFATAYDIWAQKTGKVPAVEETEPMYIGNRLESGVLDFAADTLGDLERNVSRVHSFLPLAANFDALLKETGEPVEAKTAGILWPNPGEWGESGTDQVPNTYIIQCHVQMMVSDKELAHLAALIGGRGFDIFRIPRNEQLVDVIGDASIAFWESVQRDTPPEKSAPSEQVYKAIRRVPEKTVCVSQQVVDRWRDANAARLAAEKEEAAAKSDLMSVLVDAEAGTFDGGMVTYFEQNGSRRCDLDALKKQAPDLYAQLVSQPRHRVLRYKAAK